jgi:hypothetical protein
MDEINGESLRVVFESWEHDLIEERYVHVDIRCDACFLVSGRLFWERTRLICSRRCEDLVTDAPSARTSIYVIFATGVASFCMTPLTNSIAYSIDDWIFHPQTVKILICWKGSMTRIRAKAFIYITHGF